ncbi:sensor domain-containing diguanylate cyclase [Aliidiomarina indica]|uniref:sensor domain-containing diguanylate cyclase n=1 Tax=Aliidiomarina indica TaxID=2749147 RepID=UPI00189077B6|nr:sensor domain-containing diguanylate cyclase [Aliidiomarina indica]
MAFSRSPESERLVRSLSKGYAVILLVTLAVVPLFAIAYVHFFQNPTLLFESHAFHEFAIAVSLLQGALIAYVTYFCYQRTKELFLCWLTLGFLGFTLIYGWHGVFTRLSSDHMMLFILFGPASRLVMAICLLIGLLFYSRDDESTKVLKNNSFWWAAIAVFGLISIFVSLLAFSQWAIVSRWLMEFAAMCVMLSCALIIIFRRIRSPLMTVYAIAVVFFAQSSISFMLGSAWNHQWWLAHAIFAVGFMALSYSVIQGFLTTGSFSKVYSQAELFEQLREEKERADDALLKLQRAHEALEVIAETDSLTKCKNRRGFESSARTEIARAQRSGSPLTFVALDLDHFKKINDQYGHSIGDEVLVAFADMVQENLRPSDILGRIGGEEFAIILPDTALNDGVILAERLRQIIENEYFVIEAIKIELTVSFGMSEYGIDGDDYDALYKIADHRMYKAKELGRNKVVID